MPYHWSYEYRIGVAGDYAYTVARSWAAGELGTVAVRDQRVVDRLIETLAMFAKYPKETIPQACGSWAGAKPAYRLMNNDSVSSEAILAVHHPSRGLACRVDNPVAYVPSQRDAQSLMRHDPRTVRVASPVLHGQQHAHSA